MMVSTGRDSLFRTGVATQTTDTSLLDSSFELADVIPSSVSATHSIDSSPASNSFDALFDSYLSSVSQTLKSSESALSHLTGTFMDGFSASFDWFTAASDNAAAKWSQQAASLGSKLEEELRSAEALLSKLQSKDDKEEDLSMQPLRFSGLQEVESTYGVESEEFAKAKELVKEAVEEITSLFKSKSAEQGRQASIAFVVTDSSSNLVKRSTSDLLSPLLPRQTFSTLKKGSSPSPLPKNLLSTCFTSASSLEKATNNCSGHGKAVQSSKGGKPCYRCQCKPTEVRKGKKVYWAGAACEKKDVSTEFVLLASSVLLLVIVAGGSVYALASQGGQELPGTLASVSINLK